MTKKKSNQGQQLTVEEAVAKVAANPELQAQLIDAVIAQAADKQSQSPFKPFASKKWFRQLVKQYPTNYYSDYTVRKIAQELIGNDNSAEYVDFHLALATTSGKEEMIKLLSLQQPGLLASVPDKAGWATEYVLKHIGKGTTWVGIKVAESGIYLQEKAPIAGASVAKGLNAIGGVVSKRNNEEKKDK